MPKPSECAHCTKPATIHLTQIKDNQILKIDMCESCVFKDKLAGGVAFEPLNQLAAAVSGAAASVRAVSCPACGTSQDDLRRTGRFGCGTCYDAFSNHLAGILKGIQPALAHEGKVPRVSLRRRERQQVEQRLRAELEKAIREERFEEAAGLRDRLRQLDGEDHGSIG